MSGRPGAFSIVKSKVLPSKTWDCPAAKVAINETAPANPFALPVELQKFNVDRSVFREFWIAFVMLSSAMLNCPLGSMRLTGSFEA